MRSALHIAKIQTQLLHESAYNHMQSFRFQGYFLVLVGVDAEMSYLAWGLVTPETYGRGTTPQETHLTIIWMNWIRTDNLEY